MKLRLLAMLMLAGCPRTVPPPLFGDDLPPATPPELPELPQLRDSCPDAGYRIGARAPHLDDDDRVTCAGLVLGVNEVARLEHDASVDLPWYRSQLAACTEYRALDRSTANTAVESLRGELWETQRQLRTVRRALPWVAVGAAVVGAGFAVGILAAQQQVAE